MDAVRCKEWRILPGLSLLKEKTGFGVFLFAHIPLFFFIIWKLTYISESNNFIRDMDLFMIAHIGLHGLLLKHKNNEFKDWISWTLIISAGFFGLLDLLF
jgi:hypothetical protein